MLHTPLRIQLCCCACLLLVTLFGPGAVAQVAAPPVADPAVQAIEISVQESVRQGDPFFVHASGFDPWPGLGPGQAGGMRLRLTYANGNRSPFFDAFIPALALRSTDRAQELRFGPRIIPPQPEGVLSWLAAVHPDAAAGPARLELSLTDGSILAQASIMVESRRFISMDIPLTPSLTSIRVDPDPVKDEQSARYNLLLATVNPASVYLDAPFIMPVASQRRTAFFGDRRRYMYSNGSVSVTMHNGVDYGVPIGTPLVAAGRGRVVMAEDRITTGKTVVLEHLPGVYSIYMHMDSFAVETGQILPRGWPIGTSGVTGLATGPHLHWELRINLVPVDPEAMLTIDNFPKIHTILDTIERR